MTDFETEIKQGFLEEAAQLIADAEQCFLTLESTPDDKAIIDQLFRLAHNLKGSGNAVGFLELGNFTHKLESLLLKIKNKELSVQKPVIDLLLKCNDHLQIWIRALQANINESIDSQVLIAEITTYLEGGPALEALPESDRVSETESKFEPSFESSEAYPAANAFVDEEQQPERSSQEPAIIAPVLQIAPSIPADKASPKSSPAKNADESIRVSLARLEKLINFVGEMVILQSVLREQSHGGQVLGLRKTIHQLGKVTKEVQDISMSLRMIPLKQIFQKMQRIVRDTSASLGKQVDLTLEGEDTDVDKTVLESLGDPLVHLIRNAVDHGIESTAARKAAGKPEAGHVLLKAYHQSGSLVIEIRDDGAGLDPVKLRAKAVEKGIIRPNAVLSDAEACQLIFAAGFSTKTEVTDVSGRGVGMDVVKTNIDALEGEIQIETNLGKGTCFKIRLPLTLAIIDGMIVKSQGERFVIPLSHVHETIRSSESDVKFLTGVGEVFSLRGESLPLHHLGQMLGKKPSATPSSQATAIVVRGHGQAFAVIVDEIIGQAQVVIKQLGPEHKDLRGFSASAILGDGRPALILELEDLRSRQPAPLAQPALIRKTA